MSFSYNYNRILNLAKISLSKAVAESDKKIEFKNITSFFWYLLQTSVLVILFLLVAGLWI